MLVVVAAPVLDQHSGFGETREQLDAEQLVAHPGAEALDVWVLPRRARLDVRAARAREPTPVSERVGGQLGPVVAANEPGRAAELGDEALQRRDGLVGVDAAVTLDRERLAGELVDDMQQLENPAVGGLIELKVQRPDVIGRLCAQPVGRHRRGPEALALAPALRHAQPLLTPQPLRTLAIQHPALLEQQLMRTPIPPPRPLARDLPQRRPQPGVVAGHARLVTLRRTMLPDISARPPLGNAKAVLEHPDRLAPTRRAHQFPLLISFSAATSST